MTDPRLRSAPSPENVFSPMGHLPKNSQEVHIVFKTSVSALAASCLLAGCFASTPKQFEEVAKSKTTLTVESNYQAAYRKVVTLARECWAAGMISGSMGVTGDLYTDIRTGQIQVGVHGGLGIMLLGVIDFQALSDSSTRVTISQRHENAHYAKQVRAWLAGTSEGCRL